MYPATKANVIYMKWKWLLEKTSPTNRRNHPAREKTEMSVAFLSPEESTEQRPGAQSREEAGQIYASCVGPRQRKRRALQAARGNCGSKRQKKAGRWFQLRGICKG